MSQLSIRNFQFRKIRVRKKVSGSPERPRLSVCRSLKHIYAQVVDDTTGKTLAFASSMDPEIKKAQKSGGNKNAATQVGQLIAERAKSAKVTKVVFDRGGRIFHGRVKAVAEGARGKGLEF